MSCAKCGVEDGPGVELVAFAWWQGKSPVCNNCLKAIFKASQKPRRNG